MASLSARNSILRRQLHASPEVPPAPSAQVCPALRRRLSVQVNAFKIGGSGQTASAGPSSQTALVAIDPVASRTTPSSSPSGLSIPIIAAAVGVVGVAAMVFKKMKGSGTDDDTSRYSVNMHLANVMKDVNTVRIEDLSPDQIEAARARRSKERANHKLSLEEIDLPQNHPFATKQVLSKEEQEQSLQNLRARSMRRRNFDAMQASADAARGGPGVLGRQR